LFNARNDERNVLYVLGEPLNNYIFSLASSLVRNRGADLKSCPGLPKSCNEECGAGWKPRRARPEAHICHVAPLAKDYGHSLRDAPCIYTLQVTQRFYIINQRFPGKEGRRSGQNGSRPFGLLSQMAPCYVARHSFGLAKPHSSRLAWNHLGQQRSDLASVNRLWD